MKLAAVDIPFASNVRTPDHWRLLDDAELMNLPDPEFLIDGILPRSGRSVLYGAPGSCKTTFVAGLVVALARGGDWYGYRICRPGLTCYAGNEDLTGWKVRLRANKVAAGVPPDQPIGIYTFPEPIDLLDIVSVDGFIRFLQETGVTFAQVVIDTYAGATPGAAENSSEDTTVAMHAASKIQAALGCGVMLVHHTNAGGTRERGHSAMRGAADTMISITPVDDVIHVECSKQRNAAPFQPLTLKLTPVAHVDGVVLRLASDVLPSTALTSTQAKVLAALREIAGQDGVTKAAWRAACPDVNERSFYKVTNVLEERGYVAKTGTHFRVGNAR